MGKTVSSEDWRPIATAPADANLELSVYEDGEFHALVFPCRRDGDGWRDMATSRLMQLKMTHWRPWEKGAEHWLAKIDEVIDVLRR